NDKLSERNRMQLQLDMDQQMKEAQAESFTRRDKFNAWNSLAEKNNTVKRANFTNSMYNSMFHSQGIDKYGNPLHQDTAYFPGQTVSLANLNEEKDKKRKEWERKYDYDQFLKQRTGETGSMTTGKFGKKMVKKLSSDYAKL